MLRAGPERKPWGTFRRCLTVAALLTLVSCTTVTRTALRTGASGAGTGAGDVTGGSSDAGGINGAGGPGSAGAGVTGGGAAGTAGGAAKSAGARAGAASGAAGSTCRTPVKIGATYSSDISAGLAAVGNPTAAADAANYVQQQQALWQRAADDLNRRGGLAGCPVTVVFHDFKVLSSSGFSGESQTECADLAEDQHVFAVVSTTLENKTLITCLAQHHVVSFFYSPVYQPSPDDYAHYRGLLYEPTGLTPYRFGPFIDQYAAAGYFPPGAKVGILLADDGSGSNQYLVNQLWKPRLAARGINPVVFTYPLVQNVSDNSSIASEFSSAVLQFKAAGVDHVMVTPDNGDATIFFTPVAESQGFRPRYALDSATGAAVWSGAPAGQRANALNISYQLQDLGGTPDPAEMASNPPSTARSRCDALFKGHTGSSPPSVAYWACDPFDLMQAALNGASAVTPETLVAGVDRIHSLAASNGYSDMAFGAPNHYDGATSTRMMIWDEGAKKWHYLAPPQSVP